MTASYKRETTTSASDYKHTKQNGDCLHVHVGLHVANVISKTPY